MGKRSEFEKNPRDLYETWDTRAVEPLLRFLPPATKFIEPCAGSGALVSQLENAGHLCVSASDIEPLPGTTSLSPVIFKRDALLLDRCPGVRYDEYEIITNPPWTATLLFDLIERFIQHHPCWLLLSSDLAHTKGIAGKQVVGGRLRNLLAHCSTIVSVGRVKWFQESFDEAKDNCSWYRFDKDTHPYAQFYGRDV